MPLFRKYCVMLGIFQHLNSECNKVFANKDTLEDTVATTINQIAAYAMDCSQKLMKKAEPAI